MHVFLGLENLDGVHVLSGEANHNGKSARIMGEVSARKGGTFLFARERGPRGLLARIECRKHLLVAWAGEESGLREARLGFTDLALARMVAGIVAPKRRKALLACYQMRARGIIRRRLAPAVKAFAETLIERRQIAGREAEEIICGLLNLEVGHGWKGTRLARVANRFQKWEQAEENKLSKRSSRKPLPAT